MNPANFVKGFIWAVIMYGIARLFGFEPDFKLGALLILACIVDSLIEFIAKVIDRESEA